MSIVLLARLGLQVAHNSIGQGLSGLHQTEKFCKQQSPKQQSPKSEIAFVNIPKVIDVDRGLTPMS
jgi:hypothetical protein